MRRFLPDYERVFGPEANPYPNGWLDQYRDAWHLLGLDAVPAEPKPNARCRVGPRGFRRRVEKAARARSRRKSQISVSIL
jgi:hypothetical protein